MTYRTGSKPADDTGSDDEHDRGSEEAPGVKPKRGACWECGLVGHRQVDCVQKMDKLLEQLRKQVEDLKKNVGRKRSVKGSTKKVTIDETDMSSDESGSSDFATDEVGLDTCSSEHVFRDKNLVENVRHIDHVLSLHKLRAEGQKVAYS
ncbi:hypothetical protein FVE85_7737 [Porphyridium purpureum]|uniref:CCHC-type domain-containing protein n=1 Tax=Porphyridium purpureum TaxID=35688 RepID=A0A5J4YIL3_PORPP|nr:hypothetical protein FVE85_7737 [Porphyridium purpureum]|eukprot:POR6892..scf210_14